MSQSMTQAVRDLLEAAVANPRGGAPGVAAVGGGVLGAFSEAAGEIAVRRGEPLTTLTRFPISCVVKPMVALVCLELERRGQLSLDDDIGEHLPELRTEPGQPTGIKITHLLSHTAGYIEPKDPDARWGYSWDRFAAFFRQRDQAFPPGRVWSYTHTGYVILGKVIEAITGRPALEVLDEELLAPLGIAPRVFAEAVQERTAFTALHMPSIRTRQMEAMGAPRDTGFFRCSISDLSLSTIDLHRIALYLAGGLDDLLPSLAASRRRLFNRVATLPPFIGSSDAEVIPDAYGLGVGLFGGVGGVNGSFVGSTCALRFDPAAGTAVAVALNAWVPQTRDRLTLDLETLVAEHPSHRLSSPVDPDLMRDLEGQYEGLMLGTTARFEIIREGPGYLCRVKRPKVDAPVARLALDQGQIVASPIQPGFALALERWAPDAPTSLLVGACAYRKVSDAV